MKPSAKKRVHDNYFNLNKPSAYTSIKRVATASKVKPSEVVDYLKDQPSYTLFKKVKRKFERRKTYGIGCGQTVQTDLAEFGLWRKENSGINYLLIGIDVYSRMVFGVKVKQKNGVEMRKAMTTLFDQLKARFGHVCSRLISDMGNEFRCKEMASLYKANNVQHYSPKSEMKAAVAERTIRSFKSRLYKYLHHKGTHRWIDVVDQIIAAMNKTPNRSIGMAPEKVRDGDIDEHLPSNNSRKKVSVAVGDSVRISKTKKTFEKGYTPNWTTEIFIVDKVKNNFKPPYLKLRDLAGESIEGSFYLDEVQKVIDSAKFKVEKILRKRKFRGKEQLFVRWIGHDASYDSWIDANSVVKLR